MTFQELRALFPAVVRNTYLNAAAASPIALPIERVIADHYREAVEQGDVGFGSWLRRKEDTRAAMAKLLGARNNEVAFTPNTSTGFSLIASLFVQRGLREVLTLAHEFPSTTLPLLNAGLRLRVVQPRDDGTYPVEALEAAIGPETGAIAASAVQFSSGFRLDLARTAALARDRKLLFAVNAAQALGQVPVDVGVGIDFLAATSHKWLMGGYGVGIFFARNEALEGLRFPIAGWISAELPMAMDNLIGATKDFVDGGRVVLAQGVQLKHDATAVEVGSHA
ncbi:MAG TPA: aminotransferase class V-fold PLP-dependent enzyme, partial [Gemmatimonadaceae bacterium]|nr:aminotransferase class V-fold PLP-dependent enzyme [Gemmatimonadaceae bacterium]